jgi:hypothetical protein
MKEHEHATQNAPETKQAHDEVAKKAYAIYLKEGRPQGRDVQNWKEAEAKMPHASTRAPWAHGGGLPETLLDLFGLDPADSRPLADAPDAGGTAGSHSFSRRHLCPLRPFLRGLLVWRLAVFQRGSQN